MFHLQDVSSMRNTKRALQIPCQHSHDAFTHISPPRLGQRVVPCVQDASWRSEEGVKMGRKTEALEVAYLCR